MTTVLVTGGAGFIATHTDIELLNKGYDVISVDNYGNSSPVALERVEQITGKPVKRYDGDVRDEALAEQLGCVSEKMKMMKYVHTLFGHFYTLFTLF